MLLHNLFKFIWHVSWVQFGINNYFTVSVFGWPDANTRENCERVKKSARNTSRTRVIFWAFPTPKHIPKCLDEAIQTRKPSCNCFVEKQQQGSASNFISISKSIKAKFSQTATVTSPKFVRDSVYFSIQWKRYKSYIRPSRCKSRKFGNMHKDSSCFCNKDVFVQQIS